MRAFVPGIGDTLQLTDTRPLQDSDVVWRNDEGRRYFLLTVLPFHFDDDPGRHHLDAELSVRNASAAPRQNKT